MKKNTYRKSGTDSGIIPLRQGCGGQGIQDSESESGNRFAARQSGFTLIEVLASMAVLIVLVLALTRMFAQASSITRNGMTALSRNSEGETAMETLLQDTEGMAVNERLACFVDANVTDPNGFGFDDVWFITTSGDQDDGRAYQLMHYFVTNKVATSASGAKYVRFQLYREMWVLANADRNGVDVMGTTETEWWDYDLGRSDMNMLANNVVRFDVYALGWDGKEWMSGNPQSGHTFNSTVGASYVGGPPNVPPAAFDVYLQITSPETAAESGMALMPGVDAETQRKAREKMIRDSASLFGRASPIIGAAQLAHPVEHYN